MNIIKFVVFSVIIGTFGYLAWQSNAPAIPDYVYTPDRMDQAQADALAEGKPLLLLYTSEETTCGLSKAATRDTLKYFKDKSIEVCVRSNVKSDWYRLPRFVKRAFRSPEAGRFIPKTVIVDPDMTDLITVIPYTRESKDRKRLFENGYLKISEYFNDF